MSKGKKRAGMRGKHADAFYVDDVPAITSMTVTQAILGGSQQWEQLTAGFDIVAICEAGVLDMKKWTMADHVAVREWATEPDKEQPALITAHVDEIKNWEDLLSGDK